MELRAEAPGEIAVGEQPLSVATGDLNADGTVDLAIASVSQSSSNYPQNVWIFLGNGNGTFVAPTPATAGQT